jgi:superfamily II DNA helicase RecQ
LYRDFRVWTWKWTKIFRTYETMSNESWMKNDMRVWAIIRVLEKYNILKRWVDDFDIPDDFRWRWITLLEDKKLVWKLEVDWNHQDALKQEAYFKLEQIKKLLFYPSCRKKFILNYFWDKEDLAKIWNSCGACDYCIEKKKLANQEIDDFVKTSVFAIVLEIVKKFDTKFWVQTITRFLRGSWDKKLIEWKMNKYKEFWILSDLNPELIQAVIEALISLDYLYKTSWQYPLLWITETGRIAIVKDFLLKDDNRELQQFIKMRLWSQISKKVKKKALTGELIINKLNKASKDNTFDTTLNLIKEWKWLKEIAVIRSFNLRTIEDHIVKLYNVSKISLNEVLNYVDLWNLKIVKNVLNGIESDKLRPIKDVLKEKWYGEISYFEIKIAIIMIEKGDL